MGRCPRRAGHATYRCEHRVYLALARGPFEKGVRALHRLAEGSGPGRCRRELLALGAHLHELRARIGQIDVAMSRRDDALRMWAAMRTGALGEELVPLSNATDSACGTSL